MKHIKEFNQFVNESFFRKFKFNSHKNHNPTADILQGHLDDDTFITYGIYVKDSDAFDKGDEFMEIYTGSNYNPNSTKRSNSRVFAPDKIPNKYKKSWEELKSKYQKEYK